MKYLSIMLFSFTNLFAQKVLVNDNFEKDNFNLSRSKDNYNVHIGKEGLILENLDQKNAKWSLIDVNKDFDTLDFDVETTITLLKSNTETSGYGLVWAGYNDNSNYHVVNLNAKKQNQAYWYHNKKFTYELKWTENKNIKSKKENTIKISRRAQNVMIYVNDEIILKTNTISYFGDKFGFILEQNTSVKVSHIKITEFPISIDVTDSFDPTLEVKKLPESISSENYSEKNPVVSSDGKTLYFNRKYSNSNTNNTIKSDAWMATYENGNWLNVQNMGSPINNDGSNFIISVSPDNNKLLLANVYSKDGLSTISKGLSISNKKEDSWEIPQEIKIKDFVNKNKYVSFFLTNDNKHLLMTIEKDGGQGLKDLYVSFLEKNQTWSTPLNMGNVINTSEEEANPFLAADGKTLYFSSKGHPGYGAHDLFVSKRLDDTWQNWSKPKNLGNIINTKSSELSIFLSAKGDIAYLGRGNDLYTITNTVKQDPVVLIKGKVYDSKTQEAIGAPIVYHNLQTNEEIGTAVSDPKYGSYNIVLPYGAVYSFMAEKLGYYAVTQNIDLTKLTEYKEINVDLYLNPIEKGQTIRLNNIFFESGKYDLLSESFAELDKLCNILKENNKLQIEIAGHTDAVGSDANNMTLSNNRANSVMNYLIEKGIDKSRLSAKGYGETKFIATNETEEDKQLNRRVEFIILEM